MGVWVGGVCGGVGVCGMGLGGGVVGVRVCVHLCFISDIQIKFML